jgi:hypothetical protein
MPSAHRPDFLHSSASLLSDPIERFARNAHFRFEEHDRFGIKLMRLAQVFTEPSGGYRLAIPMQSAVLRNGNVVHGRHEPDEVMGVLPIGVWRSACALSLGRAAREESADAQLGDSI